MVGFHQHRSIRISSIQTHVKKVMCANIGLVDEAVRLIRCIQIGEVQCTVSR